MRVHERTLYRSHWFKRLRPKPFRFDYSGSRDPSVSREKTVAEVHIASARGLCCVVGAEKGVRWGAQAGTAGHGVRSPVSALPLRWPSVGGFDTALAASEPLVCERSMAAGRRPIAVIRG